MRAVLLVALLALPASAQRIRLTLPGGGSSGGGGGTVAQTTPAANPGALSACAALAGAYGSATPVGESAPRPYFCDGVAWSRIYTAADGTLPNADTVVPGYTFVAQAPSGAYGYRALNNGVLTDFGAGASDYFYSDGSQVYSAGSIQIASGQAITTNIIGTTSGGILSLFPGSWVVYQGVGGLPTCDASSNGGVIRLATDSRLYYCDGTMALRLSRSLPTVSDTQDLPNLLPGDCSVRTVTVPGAAITDYVVNVSPSSSLTPGLLLGNARVSAANTATFDVCNVMTTAAIDQPPTTFNVTVSR